MRREQTTTNVEQTIQHIMKIVVLHLLFFVMTCCCVRITESFEVKHYNNNNQPPSARQQHTTTMYSFWLLPEPQLQSRLKQLIKELAQQYNSIVFEPHITLLSDRQGEFCTSDEDALEALQLLYKQCMMMYSHPVTIPCQTLHASYGQRYTQCVFWEWNQGEVELLYKLHVQSCQVLGLLLAKEDYMPHMSLLYGSSSDLSEVQRQDIASSLRDEAHSIDSMKFDTLQVIKLSTINETKDDIAKWETLGNVRLASSD